MITKGTNVSTFSQILSTNYLRKPTDISLENFLVSVEVIACTFCSFSFKSWKLLYGLVGSIFSQIGFLVGG